MVAPFGILGVPIAAPTGAASNSSSSEHRQGVQLTGDDPVWMGGFRLEIDLVGEELHANENSLRADAISAITRTLGREASKCVVFGLQPGR